MKAERKRELKKKICSADVISFDVFDTLVFRKTKKPEDIFEEAEFLLMKKGFCEKRKQYQIRASRLTKRKNGFPHATLNEIYEEWKKKEDGVEKLREGEIACESREIIPNIVIKEIYEYAIEQKKRMIVISDMYLEKEIIKELLEKCGYLSFHAIYVSSDIKKTKYDGDIYPYVIKKEKCQPEKILHIGDSQKSDIKKAERFGINTFFYSDVTEDKEDSMYGKSNNAEGDENQSFWYTLGYQTGGPFYLYLYQWIKRMAGNKKCFCIARDGYVLNELFKQFAPGNSEYIYMSRRALQLAAITELDEKTLEYMPPFSCGQTIQQVLSYLDLQGISEKEFIQQGFSSLTDIIKTKADMKKIKQVFKNNESYILKKCEEERKAAMTYFDSLKINELDAVFFDAGWNGSTQNLFDRVLKAANKIPTETFLYAGIKKSKNSRRNLENKKYKAFLFQNIENSYRSKLECATAVLELFFSAPHSSLHSYSKTGLIFEDRKEENYVEAINRGILDYIAEHKNLKISKEYATREMIRLICNPTGREAMIIGRIKNVDIYSESKNQPKYLAYLTKEQFLKNPRTEIFWAQGIYNNPENGWEIKILVFIRQCLLKIKNLK